jgi:hypothetical protein
LLRLSVELLFAAAIVGLLLVVFSRGQIFHGSIR